MIPTLTAKRLSLRPLSYLDQAVMADTIMSDRKVMEWLPSANAASTFEGRQKVALEYITEFITPWDSHGFGVWAVCLHDPGLGVVGDFIGYCGFLPEKIKGAGPEIAYAIKKNMWGKNLATEALNASLDWIFSARDFLCVHAVTDKGNKASRKVLEKVGMRYEKEVDLYDSVTSGNGLLPFYSLDRTRYHEIKKLKRPDNEPM